MTEQLTIAELAHRAVGAPDQLSHPDIIRLGAWVVDHDEHIAAFRRDTAIAPSRLERLGEAARVTTQAPVTPLSRGSMLPLPDAPAEPAAPQPNQLPHSEHTS